MERSDIPGAAGDSRSALVLGRARVAYERTHILSAVRGLAIAAAITALAVALHRTSSITWLVAGVLATTLAVLGWRGGAWRRGALAGVLAGLPPLFAPIVVFAIGHGGHCPDCPMAPSLTCMLACFGTSSIVGLFVGHAATRDVAPSRFALAAVVSAAATGLLGCVTTGLGGALGVVIGLVAGGVTGWVVARPSEV